MLASFLVSLLSSVLDTEEEEEVQPASLTAGQCACELLLGAQDFLLCGACYLQVTER